MTSTMILASAAEQTVSAVTATISEIESVPAPTVVSSLAQLRFELSNRDDVGVVLLDRTLEDSGLDMAREMTLEYPLVAVLLLSEQADSSLYSAAMNAGARGLLMLPPSVEEYTLRLQSAAQWASSAQRGSQAERLATSRSVGRIVAVVGAKGGVGTSILSVLSARECAKNGPTCLVDMDVRQGDLAAYCQVRVRRTIADLISVATELSGREISEVTYPARFGVSLLPAPDDGELGEGMTEVAARHIIQALRYQYEQVIIDCGSHLEDGYAAALDLADEIVIVATPDTPSLRSVRRLTAAMDRLGLGQGTPTHLVLNRTTRRAEIQASSAEKLAGVPLLAEIPDLSVRLDAQVNTSAILEINEPHLVAGAKEIMALSTAERMRPAQPVSEEVPADSSPKRRTRRESSKRQSRFFPSREKSADESGQVAVEFAAAFVIATTVFFLCVQAVLLGASALLAHNSAQEAARNLATGMSLSQAEYEVQERLPGVLRTSTHITDLDGSEVEVSSRIPGLLGLPTPSATAQIDWEY